MRSREPPPAGRPMQSRVLRSGRLKRGFRGWASGHPGRSPFPLGTRVEDRLVRGKAESPGRGRPRLEGVQRAGRQAG